ncbi:MULTISPECIES: phosphotransferase [unclassified Ruegeria]|uniref:phosphotransferase n=1 Tax=unclassified Ruegeria TaxID=2625375 RepID=UPI001269527C|nr:MULTISPECIES: phosphotransferase [unclassified Ruegeria]NOE24771.1 phosphotransferase [Ruegeria sp. HKCCD6157]QFT75117.1 Choline/ethanolamine kinase [Ruegeria sp. THAF33]
MSHPDLMTRIRALPIWQGEIEATPLTGGITNVNYKVTDGSGSYVVRVGDDIPLHQVMRFNELAASKAANAAGLSPAVLHSSGDLTVLEFIESRTLTEEDVRHPNMLPRVLELVKACHVEVPKHLRGPSLVFWVFHVIQDYAATLTENDSAHAKLIPDLIDAGTLLEREARPYDIVFGHNDLLCGNFLDDGNRLWLIDFDYAGFNSPLFDLGGLASNNGLSSEQEDWVLESYFEAPVTDDLRHRYAAMKCASLLRETMWSMVSEITSDIDFDYAAYTAENLARFRAALTDFKNT